MKKVLFVATTAKSHINTFHLPHIKFFKNKGWSVHVATNGDEKVLFADREFCLPISRNPFRIGNIFAVFDLIRIMKNEKYDLVSSHTPMGGVIARIAAFFAKTSCIIYMAHGFHFYNGAPFFNKFYKVIEEILARVTDVIITMNEEDFKAAEKFTLRKNGKVYKIPGIGVGTKKISNASTDKKIKRIQLGIKENEIVILNTAEMIKRKNQKTILKAFAKINCDNAILLICGRGRLEKKLKLLSKKLGISYKVKFLGFREDIPEILAISDIFVLSSFHEGLPLAVIESMAAGIPVICSDIRGNNDLIIENENGFLLDCKDINGFAEKIDLLCNDKFLRNKLGQKNKRAVSMYDIENVLLAMEKIYAQILEV